MENMAEHDDDGAGEGRDGVNLSTKHSGYV